MKTIPAAEQHKGRPFADWSEAEVREEYLALARVVDLLESAEETRPPRRVRRIPLKSLLPPSLRKETRGRKQDVPITDEQLLDLVAFGRGLGHGTAKASFLDYAKWYLEQTGRRFIGNQGRIATRLQKRYSEAKKFRNK